MKALRWTLLTLVLIQLVPFGHTHTNPPQTKEPPWSSPQVRELTRRACFACHGNQTTWPWYSNIAPVSWLLQRDVNGGRRHLNFTEWDREQRHAKDVAAQLRSGDMPPWFYLPLHPEAKLTAAERQALIQASPQSFGPQSPPRK